MLGAISRVFWCWCVQCQQLLLAFRDVDSFTPDFHEGALLKVEICLGLTWIDISFVTCHGMWCRTVLYAVTDRSFLPQNGDSSSALKWRQPATTQRSHKQKCQTGNSLTALCPTRRASVTRYSKLEALLIYTVRMSGISGRYKDQSVKYKGSDHGTSAVCCLDNSAFGLTEEHRQKYKKCKKCDQQVRKIWSHASIVVTNGWKGKLASVFVELIKCNFSNTRWGKILTAMERFRHFCYS